MTTELMDNAIPGAIGRASKSGLINEELFTDWFDHFVETVRPKTRQDPTLLIMDGHPIPIILTSSTKLKPITSFF